MKNEFVVLNNIQSHIITWGNPFHSKGYDVILCISGNPGITDYYKEFASELHRNTGLPVCVVGQAGHEEVPDKISNCLKNQEHLFNLQGQIQHKLELINNYIDKESKLHLIGHSIGAWQILELLKDNPSLNKQISSINLLFPTLQRMAETNNGKYVNSFLRRSHGLLLILLKLANFLPGFILTLLAEVYLRFQSLPPYYLERTLKFFKPNVVEKVLFLAYNEMDVVKSLNKETLDVVKHLTNVIFSSKDGWAPLDYMDDLRVFQPPLQMTQVDVEHAFVLKSSELIAEFVAEFIKTKIKNEVTEYDRHG